MTDKPDKIKVIIWEQLDSKIAQRTEEAVKVLLFGLQGFRANAPSYLVSYLAGDRVVLR